MLKRKIYFLILLGFASFLCQAQEKNYITQKFNEVYTKASFLTDLKNWREKERSLIFDNINGLPEVQKAKYLELANQAQLYTWPSITASLYLDYKNTGRRVDYENLHNKRQEIISLLAIGSLIKNDDTYIPQLVNGLWLLLEESTWVAPAHIVVQPEGADLPSPTTSYIDLHASRTSYRVALIYFLLKDKIQQYSKVVNKRILSELDNRIFKSYLANNNFFWMGFDGRAVNNWNSFNNSNCFNALIYSDPSDETIAELTPKIIKSADAFLNHYPADGGCDEGPTYWDMAGGRLINLLDQLYAIADKKIDFSDNELLHNMGTYTYKMHINNKYYINFADAHAIYTQNPVAIYQYGLTFNDEQLKQYAGFVANEQDDSWGNDIISFIERIKVNQQLSAIEAKPPYSKFVALPDLQVFAGRQEEGSTNGLFYAIKGGHNNESHNHNDIGNFIVYANGEPLLIDIGVGTYTAKTFSKQRYEIWNMQSNWHNCPTINGFDQVNGRNYQATKVIETHNNKVDQVSMDLSKAYPKEAGIVYWNRTLELNRAKKQISLKENFEVTKSKDAHVLNYISLVKPVVTNNRLVFGDKASMLFDPSKLEIRVVEKEIDDERLVKIWGKKIYQIKLVAKERLLKDKYEVIIKATD